MTLKNRLFRKMHRTPPEAPPPAKYQTPLVGRRVATMIISRVADGEVQMSTGLGTIIGSVGGNYKVSIDPLLSLSMKSPLLCFRSNSQILFPSVDGLLEYELSGEIPHPSSTGPVWRPVTSSHPMTLVSDNILSMSQGLALLESGITSPLDRLLPGDFTPVPPLDPQ